MKSRLDITILVIDDESALRDLLRIRLTKIGFVVDVAESAEEGIKKIQNTPYDLILTDIKMPGMSGNDLFDYVQTTLDRPIPVIAMSGTPWVLENTRFDAVISKPFSKEDLLGTIHQFIQAPQLL